MRTIVSFFIVIAVVNAVIRAGTVAWKYYQFKDAALEIAIYGAQTDTTSLHRQVMEKAEKLDVPVGPDEIAVTRNGPRTVIEASYVQPVEFFPRVAPEIPLTFSVEGIYRPTTTAEEILPGAR